MDAEFAQKLLDILIDNSRRLLSAGFGVNWTESSFFDAVRLLREETCLKDYFLDKVRFTFASAEPGNLMPGAIPVELIELVAHELRWPELQVLANERLKDRFGGDIALASGDIALRLSDAYQDDWQDREFYEHYRRS
jgi:hypothetical protein